MRSMSQVGINNLNTDATSGVPADAPTVDASMLGARIRRLRVAKGLTQSDIAGETFSAGYVSRIESGVRRPTPKVLAELAERLGTTPEQLLTGIETSTYEELRLSLDFAELALESGDAPAAETHALKALEGARAAQVPELLPRGGLLLGRSLETQGKYDDAITSLEQVVDTSEGITLLEAGIALSRCLRDSGDLTLAIEVGEKVEAAVAGTAYAEMDDDNDDSKLENESPDPPKNELWPEVVPPPYHCGVGASVPVPVPSVPFASGPSVPVVPPVRVTTYPVTARSSVDAAQARRTETPSALAVNPVGTVGGWVSIATAIVHLATIDPREAVPAIARWLAEQPGVSFRWSTMVHGAADGTVHTSRGELTADRVVLCPGHDVDLLRPDVSTDAGLLRCRLHMLRVASPHRRAIEPAVAMKPTLVSFYAGGNDILELRKDMDALLQQYENAVARLASTGAQLLLFTGFDVMLPPVLEPMRRRNWLYNEAVREIARRYDALLVDHWAFEIYQDPRMWDTDKLHMSPVGHKYMAAQVLSALGVRHTLKLKQLEPLERAGWRELARVERAWLRDWVVPMFGRKLKGVTLGDNLPPRWPEPVQVSVGLKKLAKQSGRAPVG